MCTLYLSAGEREAVLKPYRQQILIGEDLTIELQIRCRIGDEIIFPVLSDTINKNIEITGFEQLDTIIIEDSNLILIQQIWHVTSFDSGVWVFPPILFRIQNETIETKPFLIDVGTVEIDTAQSIRDITEPIPIPYTLGELFRKYGIPILFSSAVLIGVLFLLDRRKKKTKKKPTLKPKAEIEIPPHIWALGELKKLQEQKMWQQGEIKDFHVRLSEIARTYIELSLNVPAMESTTEEIALLLQSTDISTEVVQSTVSSLRISDLVKYAKYNPIPSENDLVYDKIVRFVEHTSPKEERANDSEHA